MKVMHSLKKARIQADMSLFGDNKALERIEDRLQRIETLCADLERENRKLGLEYIELYDKVKRQMSRMAKRSAVDAAEINAEPIIDEPDDGVDPISRSILQRRGMLRRQT